MAKQNIEERDLTIKWFMADDKIIKFEELDTTFDISDAVAAFDFSKLGVSAGSKVSVKIDKDQGSNGTVVYMTKGKGGTTNSSPNAGNTTTTTGNVMVKTVKAYGTKYDGSLLFTDNENEWYSFDKSFGVAEKKHNVEQYKDQVVEIEEYTTEKGKKRIKAIKIVNSSSSGKTTQFSPTQTNNYSKGSSNQVSIEAQACMKNACSVVAGLFAGKFDASSADDGEKVMSLISVIAKHNWNVIKELKAQA